MSDEAVIGCVRVDGNPLVALGSVKRSCADCGAAVWVAPTGVEIIKSKGAVPVCVPCIRRRIEADGKPELQPISRAQVAEAIAALTHHRRRN